MRPPAAPATRNRFRSSRLRRFLTGIAVVALLLAPVEVALRLAVPVRIRNLRERTLRRVPPWMECVTNQPPNFDPATHLALLVFDPDLLWKMRPDAAGSFWQTPIVRTNRLGLRSGPVGRKAPGVARILFLGDSTTFGYAVRRDERYSERVAAALSRRRPGGRFEVVNAGVIGYSARQGSRFLTRSIERLDPDCVLFSFRVNDCFEGPVTDVERMGVLRRPLVRLRLGLRGSNLVCALEFATAMLRRRLALRADSGSNRARFPLARYIFYGDPAPPPGRPPVLRNDVEGFLECLEQASGRCASRGIPFAVIGEVFVARDDVGPIPGLVVPEIPRILEGERSWCREHGVPFVDVRPRIEAFGPQAAKTLYLVPCHPTPRGHEVIAGAVVESLTRTGVMGRLRR